MAASFQDLHFAPRMVRVPKGHFLMGSPASEAGRTSVEEPLTEIRIEQGFAIGIHPVTFDEYAAYLVRHHQKDLAKIDDHGLGRGQKPIVYVNWHEARAYSAWLAAETGKAYRLPSEAEWEYAARAGTQSPFWCGETLHIGGVACTHSDAFPKGNGPAGTVSVDTGCANAFGLFHVHGNVREWVEDVWHDNHLGRPADGSAWCDGGWPERRVLRGGSYLTPPEACRSAARFREYPGTRSIAVGFRVAQDL